MDNRSQWGPPILGIAALGALGILMAVGCLTSGGDAPGRILAGVAAIGLLVFATGSARARPRLAITPDGLVYRGWIRTMTLHRPDLTLIRITEFRRWGRTVRLLEIDLADSGGGERLLVLSRWDLGSDPLDVLDALTAAGYAGR